MGRLFSSFDEAWRYFLERGEPLESFHAGLSDDPAATVDVWVLVPPARIKDAALELQRSFAQLDWIEPTPRHFVHVTLPQGIDWSRVAPFEVEYGRVNCFHEAVVVEVAAPALSALVEPPYLPHLTIGYVREPNDAEPLRAALTPLREAAIGAATARDVSQVRVPFARSTVLPPWTVLQTVALEPPR